MTPAPPNSRPRAAADSHASADGSPLASAGASARAGFGAAALRCVAWWDPVANVRRWGWSAAFVAATLVTLRLLRADFVLRSFAGRAFSWATAEGFSVTARTSLYAQSLVLGALAFVAALVVLRALERWFAPRTSALGNALALAGLTLLVARAFGLDIWTTYNLVASLFLAVFALGFVEQAFFRAFPLRAPEAVLAACALCALWVPILVDDQDTGLGRSGTRWMDWAVGGFAFALYLVLRVSAARLAPERRQRFFDRACVVLASGALAPVTSIVAIEIYMSLNNAGVFRFTPGEVECAVLALLATLVGVYAWRVVRRAEFELESWLARRAFPALVFGMLAFLYYRPTIELNEDLFEPANSGLMIQQLFDFGRLPFVETFNGHGFSDALMGFVWRVVHGDRDETWVHWYSAVDATLLVFTYVAIFRVSRNAYLALFSCVFFPFHEQLFPTYARVGLVAAFALAWVFDRPVARRWAALTLLMCGLFAWRLDNGFAAFFAVLGVIPVWLLLDPEFRPGWRAPLRAAVLTAGAVTLFFCVLCLWRGVNPLLRVVDLLHIVNSSQAFGSPRLADRFEPVHAVHLYLLPVLVFALVCWCATVLRGKVRAGEPARFAALFVMFGAAYYFANYPRGLVRHTFFEVGNVYLQSFSCAVIALAWYAVSQRGAFARAAGFLGTATLLGSSFHLYPPISDRPTSFQPIYQQVERFMEGYPRVPYTPFVFDRSPMWPRLVDQFYGPWMKFTEKQLAPDETFLDLAHNPMLYVLTHRRSPHYLNHLFLAGDEWLNKRAVEDFGQADVPFVLVRTEIDLAQRDQAPALVDLDMVDSGLRNYRFFEWVWPRYEPWCIVQRWQVWKRLDWASPVEPDGNDPRTRLRLAGPAAADGVVRWRSAFVPDAQTRDPAVREPASAPLALDPQRPAHLGIAGAAPRGGSVTLRLALTRAGVSEAFERRITLKAGTDMRWFALPGTLHGAEITSLELDTTAAPDFTLRELELRDTRDLDETLCWERAARVPYVDQRRVPWLWANFDEFGASERPVLQELVTGPAPLAQARCDIGIDPRNNDIFENGIANDPPGFVVALDDITDRPQPGDRIVFAHSGERTVTEVRTRRIFVDGGALDPVRDGAPHKVLGQARDPRRVPIDPGAWRRLAFEPLADPSVPCYIALRIGRPVTNRTHAYVRWGSGDRLLGSIGFELVGLGEQTYLLRPTAYPNWAREHADWLEISTLGSPIRLESVRLLAGD